ncbi:MAG TPA: hypothetical protein VF792_04025 [Ktedonobacterales bacterium]
MRRWPLRRRGMAMWLAALACILFAAFEVGVRMVTPDAVQYETQSSNGRTV